MQNEIAKEQVEAKDLVVDLIKREAITLKKFAMAMDYTYSHAWSLVHGKAIITDEFIGRMLRRWPEVAKQIADALDGHKAPEVLK